MYQPQPNIYSPYYLPNAPTRGFASIAAAKAYGKTVPGRNHEIRNSADRDKKVSGCTGADHPWNQ